MNLPEDYQNKMQKMLGGDEYCSIWIVLIIVMDRRFG